MPDPLMEEGRMPKPQEIEGTVLAPEASPPAGDVSQGGHDHQVEEGWAEGTLSMVASRGLTGKHRPDPRLQLGREEGEWPGAEIP